MFNESMTDQTKTLGTHTNLLENIGESSAKQLPLLEKLSGVDKNIQEQTIVSEKQFNTIQKEQMMAKMDADEAKRESSKPGGSLLDGDMEMKVDDKKGGFFQDVIGKITTGVMALVGSGNTIAATFAAIGSGITSFGAALVPILGTVAAITAAVVAIGALAYKFYKGVTNATDKFGKAATLTDKIASGMGEVITFLYDIVESIVNFFLKPFGVNLDFGNEINRSVSLWYKGVFDFIKSIPDLLISSFNFFADNIKGIIHDPSGFIKNVKDKITDTIKQPILDMFDTVMTAFRDINNQILSGMASMVDKIPFMGDMADKLRGFKSETTIDKKKILKSTQQFDISKVSKREFIDAQKKFNVEGIIPTVSVKTVLEKEITKKNIELTELKRAKPGGNMVVDNTRNTSVNSTNNNIVAQPSFNTKNPDRGGVIGNYAFDISP